MIYTDVSAFCHDIFSLKNKRKFILDKHKKYIRAGIGFDIETTRSEDKAFMYVWQVSYNDHQCYGRTWFGFRIFMEKLDQHLGIFNARAIIWVANLGHEFAFIGRRFHWDKVFARESHQPIIACTGRIEFREALTISGQGGLKNLSKNYTTTQKAVGDLDYSKLRNQWTPLSDEEIGYIINDVKILSEWGNWIFEEFTDHKIPIPLTRTGIPRGAIKKEAYATGHYNDIRDAVHSMFPDRETYNLIMKFLFRGGYTHANAWWVCVVGVHVIGADFTSSYPAVMIRGCYYPKSEFIPIILETDGKHITDKRMENHCVWFIAEFRGIEKITMHTVESEHKLMKYKNGRFDNGRLISADIITVSLTEIDYQIYCMFYDWTSIRIIEAHSAVRGQLPEYVLKPLKEAYKTKARIKKECKKRGILPDTIPEYRNAKATINSYYGVMVQRLNFTEWEYDEITGQWNPKESNKTYKQMIRNVILSPYWGIYVTAHARYNILSVIAEMDAADETISDNVLYSDTDSLYFEDTPRNRKIIEAYNEKCRLINADLSPEFADLGLFEWIDTDADGQPVQYRFKTLGAKRYIKYYQKWNPDTKEYYPETEVTVSGMSKGTYEKAILRTFATDNSVPYYRDARKKSGLLGYLDIDEFFDTFSDSFILTATESQRNISVYSPSAGDEITPDYEYSAEITDEYGNTELMTEKGGLAIVPTTFSIKMDKVYIQLLHEIMENRRKPIWI